MARTRGPARVSSHSAVPSDEASSTTMSSHEGPVWPTTLATASCKRGRRSRVGTTTVTSGPGTLLLHHLAQAGDEGGLGVGGRHSVQVLFRVAATVQAG